MIPLKSIQEAHRRVSVCCIHQLVNSRNGEGILWANFIQIREIYAHTPFPIFLLHHHSIGQSFEIKDFLDCPCLLKFIHLSSHYLSMLFWRASRWLLLWNCIWIHIQLVTYKLWINPEHVISAPGKHIHIIFQKLHQSCFLQGWQLRPQLKVFLLILTN